MRTKIKQHLLAAALRPVAAAIVGVVLLTNGLAEEEDDPSPVDILMSQISRDMKKLSRQFDNEASRPSSLALVDEMIAANAEASTLVPESVGDRSGEEREKYLDRYREGMAELGKCLASIKAALEANDSGQTEALIDEAYALRKKYHKELL